MILQKVKVCNIKPYGRNPRKNDGAVETVAKSIDDVGYDNPIIVDENMVVLAGHTRLKALKELGWDECEVLVAEGLSEEQKKKYRLYDNKTGELAQWDKEKLAIELEGLDFSSFNLEWGETLEEGVGVTFNDGYDDKEYEYICPQCGHAFNKR